MSNYVQYGQFFVFITKITGHESDTSSTFSGTFNLRTKVIEWQLDSVMQPFSFNMQPNWSTKKKGKKNPEIVSFFLLKNVEKKH